MTTRKMDLRDISSLRVIAGLELAGRRDMALDIAANISSTRAKAVAKEITRISKSKNPSVKKIAADVLKSVR